MPFYLRKAPLLFLFPTLIFAQSPTTAPSGWWNADRSSVGLAPRADSESRAVVQIYSAKAYSWRGYFGVHTWVSVKKEKENNYTTFEVMGFGSGNTSVIHIHHQDPDRKWYGNAPLLLFESRGAEAALLIPDIEKAVQSYPYPHFYRIWPGPNSNTFVSWIVRQTPGLKIDLPPNAIGKDWIGAGDFFGWSESKTGIQVSIYGVLGVTIGLREGIEINILGLSFGLDFLRPALKLPFIGRIGSDP